MHQSSRVTARNIAANYGGYIVNIAVAFFLSPYVVHTLGDTWYGIWTVLMSIAGSMGLIELGVIVTTGRMVNFHNGRDDPRMVAAVVNLSLLFFLLIGPLLTAATWLFGDALVGAIKDIPPEEFELVGYAMIILAANIGVGLVTSVFAVLLQARDRFDLKNAADITTVLMRTLGTVLVLEAGYGIWGLAWVTLGAGLVRLIGMLLLAARWGYWPKFGWRLINREAVREMTGFSGWAFINSAAARIFLYTNAIIVGAVLGAAEVTYFSIALMLVDYAFTLAQQAANALTPELNRTAGKSNKSVMRQVTLNGMQLTAALGIPIMLGVVFFADPFIGLWMGDKYATAAATVAMILALGKLSGVLSGPFGIAIWSMGNIKFTALINLAMAVMNAVGGYLILKFTDFGLTGISVVTALALISVNALAIPLFGTHLMEWPRLQFVGAVLRNLLPAILYYSAVAWALSTSGWIQGWLSFLLVGLGSLLIYAPFAWFWLIRPFVAGRRQLQATPATTAAQTAPDANGS